MTDTEKHYGVVKSFGDRGAYGFIQPEGGGRDVFVHITAVGQAGLRELRAGDKIEFTIETDERSGRPCAGNLKLIH